MSVIKVIKLRSGEEIIGKIITDVKQIFGDGTMTQQEIDKMNTTFLLDPFIIIYEENEENTSEYHVTLCKWILGTDDTLVPLSNASMTSIVNPSAIVRKLYTDLVAREEIIEESMKVLEEHCFNDSDEVH